MINGEKYACECRSDSLSERLTYDIERCREKIEAMYGEISARVTAISSKVRETDKKCDALSHKMQVDLAKAQVKLMKDCDRKIFNVGADLEVPIFKSEEGDWSEAKR